MLPLRHDLRRVGGSWAQRQVFNATMIEAAIKADNLPVAIGLVSELSQRKPCSKKLQQMLETLIEAYRETGQPSPKRIKMT